MKRDLNGKPVAEKQNDVEEGKEENFLNNSDFFNKKSRTGEYEREDDRNSSLISAKMDVESNKEDDQNCGKESQNVYAAEGVKDDVQDDSIQIDAESNLKTQEVNPMREELGTKIEKIGKDTAEDFEQSNNFEEALGGNVKEENFEVIKKKNENDKNSAQPIENERKMKEGVEDGSERTEQTLIKESVVGGENEEDAKDELVKGEGQTESAKEEKIEVVTLETNDDNEKSVQPVGNQCKLKEADEEASKNSEQVVSKESISEDAKDAVIKGEEKTESTNEENLEVVTVETNDDAEKSAQPVENQCKLKEDDEEVSKKSEEVVSKEIISKNANDLVVKCREQNESVKEENLEVVMIETNDDEKSSQPVENQCKLKDDDEEAGKKSEKVMSKENISGCDCKKTVRSEDKIDSGKEENLEVRTTKPIHDDKKSAQPKLEADEEVASEKMEQDLNKETIPKDKNEEAMKDNIKVNQSSEKVSKELVEEQETKMEEIGEDIKGEKIKDPISDDNVKNGQDTDISKGEKRELQGTEMEERREEENQALIGEDFKKTPKERKPNYDVSNEKTQNQDTQMEQKEEMALQDSDGISTGIEESKETIGNKDAKSVQTEDKTTNEEIARQGTKEMDIENPETFESPKKGIEQKIGIGEKDMKDEQAKLVEDVEKKDQPNGKTLMDSRNMQYAKTEGVTRTNTVVNSIELGSNTVSNKEEVFELETEQKETDGAIQVNKRSEDNSIETPLIASINFDEPITNGSSSTRLTTGRRLTFPEKLMELLNKEDCQDAMCWLTNGKAFALQPSMFMQKILPKYFEGTKFESFTRKLNRWGFKRIAGEDAPDDTFAYSHHLFKREYPELCRGMSGGKKMEQDFSHLIRYRERERLLTSAAATPGGFLGAGQFSFSSFPGTANMGTIGGIAGMGTVGAIGGLSALGGLGTIGLQSGFEQQAQLQNLLLERQLAAAGGISGSPYNNFGGSGGLERELAIREMLLRQEATAGGQAALFGANANFAHSAPPGGAISAAHGIQTGNQSGISANFGASFSPIAPGVNSQSLNMQQANLMSAALQQEAMLGTMESQPGIQILVPQRGTYGSSSANAGIPQQNSTGQENYNKRNYAELV